MAAQPCAFETPKDYVRELSRNPHLATVTRKAAANIIGVSPMTIDRHLNQGKLTGIEVGEQRLVLASDLTAWIESHEADLKKVKHILRNAARQRSVVAYRIVMEAIDLNHRISSDRDRIGKILGELSIRSHAKHGFMLSVLAVGKGSGLPNETFLGLFYRLYPDSAGVDDIETAFESEAERVYDHYAV